ncbi:MAG: hypothetical protein ACRC41_10785 [Sarcina sp.]
MNKQKVLALIVGTTMATGIVSTTGMSTINTAKQVNVKNEKVLSSNKNKEAGGFTSTENTTAENTINPITTLLNAINTAKTMNTDGYTPDSLKVLQNAITAAQGVVNNKDATVQDITTAMTNLQNAVKGLSINKGSLESAISNAKEVLALPQKLSAPEFTAETVNTLQNLINQGQNALQESDASQIEILTNKIMDATNNLIVNIPDPQFKTLLVSNIKNELAYTDNKDALGKTPVTYGELSQLKSISRNNVNGIVSIQGIQYCADLTYFQTGYGQNIPFSNYSPLATLINNMSQSTKDKLWIVSGSSIPIPDYFNNLINNIGYTSSSRNNLQTIYKANYDNLFDAGGTIANQNGILADKWLTSYQNLQNGVKSLVVNIEGLQSDIQTAKNINTNGYTSDSIKALQGAITAAQAVVNNKDATAQDVTTAMTNLQNAIKGLVVNTEALQNEINTAKGMNTDGYTPDSVKTLQGAITAAQGVVNNKDATVQDVTTAMTNLQNAVKGLVVNTEGLQTEINTAKGMNTDGYTPDSVKILQSAITAAQAVVSNKDASVQDVTTAMTNLQNAIKGLVVNTEALQNEINTAKGMSTNGYTPDSVKTLQSAITAAQAVVSNKDANAQDVNTAMTNLQNAVKGLVVNTEGLQTEINTAKGMNTDGYTPDSVKTLQSAITAAQGVVSNKDASVQDVTTAMTNLQNAVKGLVKESINVISNTESAYFEPYGLVLNVNLNGMNFAQNSVKDLIVENSNGQKVTIKGVNVNWYSKDSTNFSGAQFIITPDILKELGGTLNAKLSIGYMHGNVMQTSALNNKENIKGAAFDIPFNLVDNDGQATLQGINDVAQGTSTVKTQYTEPYGLVVNTANNFNNQILTKNDKIQLIVKNSKGNIINTFDGVNVDWYSLGNYSGSQFIIPSSILNELKAMEKNNEKLNFEVSYNNMVNILSLNIG